MGDGYEEFYVCLDPLTGDSLGDADTDGLSNLLESSIGSNPATRLAKYTGWPGGGSRRIGGSCSIMGSGPSRSTR